jgi:F0F1-type ATP synthase assembly protein I
LGRVEDGSRVGARSEDSSALEGGRMAASKKERDQWRQALEMSALGFMFPIAIALGFGAGWLLDRTFGTWPWLTALFSVFGIAAAFLNLFRMSSAISDDGSDEHGE